MIRAANVVVARADQMRSFLRAAAGIGKTKLARCKKTPAINHDTTRTARGFYVYVARNEFLSNELQCQMPTGYVFSRCDFADLNRGS